MGAVYLNEEWKKKYLKRAGELKEDKGNLEMMDTFMKQEVWKTLEPYQKVRKREQALEFIKHSAAGVVPIAGPVLVTFSETLYYTLQACKDVGLIEKEENVKKIIKKKFNSQKSSDTAAKMATKDGLHTAVDEVLIDVVQRIVYEEAVADLVYLSTEEAVVGFIPFLGPSLAAAKMKSRYRHFAEKLATKTYELHRLWIKNNIQLD